MKKVMCFGTFDLLHPGHLSFLRQAREFGDYLIVVVARDENVKKVKNKKPEESLDIRIKNLEKSRLADEVVPGSLVDKYFAIKKFNPDIICLGYDQEVDLEELGDNFKGEIVRLESYKPHIYKTSKLKGRISYDKS